MANFAISSDGDDDFQELLNGLPELSPVVPGKRGGGRKSTNNIGADILGYAMLKILRTVHHVDLFQKGNLQGNTLWGIIDQKSFDRARQIAMNNEPSYSQVGVYAVSLSQSADKVVFVQWWKATLVKGILSFQKVLRKGADYQLCKDLKGNFGLWKMDSTTGLPQEKNENGDYISFPFNELVDFEVYLNAIVEMTGVPVSFPDGEVDRLRGLSTILANVNVNTEVIPQEVAEIEEEIEEEEEE